MGQAGETYAAPKPLSMLQTSTPDAQRTEILMGELPFAEPDEVSRQTRNRDRLAGKDARPRYTVDVHSGKRVWKLECLSAK